MIFNHEKEFDSAEELIGFFQKHSFFRTNAIWETNTIGRGSHVYRGQADSEWELVPSVFRTHKALLNFTPQTSGEYSGNNKVSWLGWHLHAEMRAVSIFLETADKLGIKTPIDYSRMKEHHELIFAALNEDDYDYSQAFPSEKTLEELALAQHHGIPTRLLDWSESPFVACFFAALGASSITSGNERVKSSCISVTCFDTSYLYKSDEIIGISAPRHRNNFLRLQQGIFTHMPKANDYFLKNGEWPCVEDIIGKTKKLEGALKKYYLPSSEADNLLRELFDYGITKHQLMPTLDNVAQSYSYVSKLFK